MCKTKLATSWFSKRYVFAVLTTRQYSQISTLDTVFEKLRFLHRKLRLFVDGRSKWINKYAKIYGYVWTGPYSFQTCCNIIMYIEKIAWMIKYYYRVVLGIYLFIFIVSLLMPFIFSVFKSLYILAKLISSFDYFNI